MEIIKPMLATLVDKPFDNKDFLFEYKLDGYRAIAQIENGEVRLYSRNNITLNKDFPNVVDSLSKLGFNTILDGELVVLDENGISNFQLLQNYRSTGKGNLVYYVFDCLYLNGLDLKSLPLLERKKTLKKLIKDTKYIKKTEYVLENGIELFKKAKKNLMEGIIAKQIDSSYVEDRTMYWQKVKAVLEQEVVIGGYTFPSENRESFGSLLMGVYQDGKFIYVGHTGSGFSSKSLSDLKKLFDKYKTNKSPFDNDVPEKNIATWLKPKIVAEIKFANWTESGLMRQAIFLGVRDDKDPLHITKEK